MFFNKYKSSFLYSFTGLNFEMYLCGIFIHELSLF